jgi:hypothetical protein
MHKLRTCHHNGRAPSSPYQGVIKSGITVESTKGLMLHADRSKANSKRHNGQVVKSLGLFQQSMRVMLHVLAEVDSTTTTVLSTLLTSPREM